MKSTQQNLFEVVKPEEAIVTIVDIFKIFSWGVDVGLLKAEEEREADSLYDAAVCYRSAQTRCVPSTQLPSRQIHSNKWFEAKQESMKQFKLFMNNLLDKKG